MSNLAANALLIAKSQIGKTEQPLGSNWGEPVKTYLKSVGITFPASWCMAFMYWCYEQSAAKDGVKNPMAKTGGVLDQLAKRKLNVVVSGDPQPGDIFIMDHGGGLGHTGMVEKYENGILYTIEGNTNDTGSREGTTVLEKDNRKIPHIKAFLRF